MKSKGNGEPKNCMANLLRIIRGEVRMDILRGLDSAIIDLPETFAMTKLRAEAYWLVSNYEPRVEFQGGELEGMNSLGDFIIMAKGEEE